jgi:glucose/arabinose dehydrogenase
MWRRVGAIAVSAAIILAAGGCTIDTIDPGEEEFGPPVEGAPGSSTAVPAITGAPPLEAAPVVTTIVAGLRIPWGLAFLPDGTALVTERGNPGVDGDGGGARILAVTPDGSMTELQRLSEVDTRPGEGGLLGIAVSPTYYIDELVYIYYSAADDNRIAKLRLGQPPEPIVTGIPVAGDENGRYHQGGRLAFGPDGMLYASVGETYFDSELAQDLNSLGGKILRMTPDGEPAPGNPFPGSLVWSYGHRNVQGLAWDRLGRLWATEFGQNETDEVNLIRTGRNYGWPAVEGRGDTQGGKFTNPVVTWSPTSTSSPSGDAIVGSTLYVAALQCGCLWQIRLNGTRAGRPRKLLAGRYGRLRTVVRAPDGSLWVATSNRDGRGDPEDGDDRIVRLRP